MRIHSKGYQTAILVLFLILFSLTGCKGNPEKPSPEEGKKKPPEVPEILTEMEDNILETLYAIDGVPGIEKSIQEKEKAKAEIEKESEVDQTKEEKEGEAKKTVKPDAFIAEESLLIPLLDEQQVESDILELEEPPDDIKEIWQKLEKNLYQIHRQWNVLETHLQEAKIPKTDLEKTEAKLDKVTLLFGENKTIESMMELNGILNDLSDYRSNFHDKVPSEMYQLRVIVRQIVLLSAQDKYEEAQAELEKLKEIGKHLKPRLIEKDASAEIEKFTLSVEDLAHDISIQEFSLVQIKAAIVMKNIELMSAPFEAGQ